MNCVWTLCHQLIRLMSAATDNTLEWSINGFYLLVHTIEQLEISLGFANWDRTSLHHWMNRQCLITSNKTTVTTVLFLLAVPASWILGIQCPLSGPNDCFFYPTITGVVECLESFTVPNDTWINDSEFATAELTPSQLLDYTSRLDALLTDSWLNLDCGDVPKSLSAFVTIRPMTNSAGSYCIIHESTFNGTRFTRGLPVVVVRNRATTSRFIHISAPHPIWDTRSTVQAAAVYESTGARSLVIATRQRDAYKKQGCAKYKDGKPVTPGWVTDGAHHDRDLFHQVNLRLRAWQESIGCLDLSCAYLQFHGMAEQTCPYDQVFISSGIANSTWYNMDGESSRANRFREFVESASSSVSPATWTVSTPGTSSCRMTAASNIFGRICNGVLPGRECFKPATMSQATGQFISIESHIHPRLATYDKIVWGVAVRRTFHTTCDIGYIENQFTGLCQFA